MIDLKNDGVKPAYHILNKYKRDVDLYNSTINKIENNMSKKSTGNKVENTTKNGSTNRQASGKLDSEMKLDEAINTHKPKLEFPNFGQINTINHPSPGRPIKIQI